MDKILISQLRFEAVIGVHEHEKRRRQILEMDLELAIDAARAARNDDLADALNYEAVAAAVDSLVAQRHFALIETLAEHCAALLLDRFALPWLRLTLHKPGALPGSARVAVCIERAADGRD